MDEDETEVAEIKEDMETICIEEDMVDQMGLVECIIMG